jgi:hypothetical protein
LKWLVERIQVKSVLWSRSDGCRNGREWESQSDNYC